MIDAPFTEGESGIHRSVITLLNTRYKYSLIEEMTDSGEQISGNEWTHKSKRVEVCGMFGCQENPTSQCLDCANHYCHEHIKSYVHRI
jgi:hypothetical protein